MSSFNTDQLILDIPSTVGREYTAQSCLLCNYYNSTEHLYLSFTNHILIPYRVQCIHKMRWLVGSSDPKNYTSGSVPTGRVSLARQIKGEKPD